MAHILSAIHTLDQHRAMCAVAIFQNFTAIQKPIGDMKSLDLADKPAQPFI